MKRGWCPSLHAPMDAADGLLVRVKPPAARLTPAAAHALATAAERHGNGTIELTQRGNVQLRGLTSASVAPFACAMVQAGLAHPDAAHESRRVVIPPALLGDDPGLAPHAEAFAARVEHALATDPRFAGLPAKFAVAIEAGGVLAGRPVSADLVAWSNGAAAGLRSAVAGDAAPLAGMLPYPGTVDGAFGLAPPFGQMDAAMLHQLADLAAAHHTVLHVTPWRVLLLGRVAVAAAPSIVDAAGPRWITDALDPRLLVSACVGHPGCARASVPARADAALLRPTMRVHVSGCAKGCAHPGPSPLTLVGRDGLYDVVRDGRAGDAPHLRDLTFEQAAAQVSACVP